MEEQQFVTVLIGEQLCGVPVLAVRDVLASQAIARIPLAPPQVAGSLNLRGRIVTAIDLRRRLNLPPAPESIRAMSVVTEHEGELSACWSTRLRKLSVSRPLPAIPTRRRSVRAGRASATASIGSRRRCLSP